MGHGDQGHHCTDAAIWETTFGGSAESLPWYREAEFLGKAGWDKPGSVRLVMWDPDADDDGSATITKRVGMADVRRVWNEMLSEGFRHCGSYGLSCDDGDQCVSDAVLQRVAYGTVVYG